MKVSELIKALEQYPSDAEVIVSIPVLGPLVGDKAVSVKEQEFSTGSSSQKVVMISGKEPS